MRDGPVASFKLAWVVDRLPKTRSGKIFRATMLKIADVAEIRQALGGLGYARPPA